MPQPPNRQPPHVLADKAQIKRPGLKINNAASSAPIPKPDTTAAFNEEANAAFTKDQEYKQRGLELFTKFKKMVEDTILADNRSQLTKEIENEVVSKIIQLASEMNDDENQPEGIGSIVVSTLLMKMVLVQRDVINKLAYKIDRIEKANEQSK
jgi:hypothetical protein